MEERLGIAGSGTIACGLAALAAPHGEVVLWARSETAMPRCYPGGRVTGGRYIEGTDPLSSPLRMRAWRWNLGPRTKPPLKC